MFCSKTKDNLINKIHKRSLCVIYEMEDANFEDLLTKDSSWTIHENNIHTLLIEIYKSLNHISPPITQEFFDLKVTPYSLCRGFSKVFVIPSFLCSKLSL